MREETAPPPLAPGEGPHEDLSRRLRQERGRPRCPRPCRPAVRRDVARPSPPGWRGEGGICARSPAPAGLRYMVAEWLGAQRVVV